MPADDTMDTDEALTKARIALVEAIEGAGLPEANAGEDPELVKVGSDGLSFALRFNGEAMLLDGNETNTLPGSEFEDFLKRQKLAVESGEVDDQIRHALQSDGPHEATVRVRSVGDQSPGD